MLLFDDNRGKWGQGTVAINQTPFAGWSAAASNFNRPSRRRVGFGDATSDWADLDAGSTDMSVGDTSTPYDSGMSAADEAAWTASLDDPNPQNANGGGYDSGTTQAEDDQWLKDLDAPNPQSSGSGGVPDVPIDWSKIAGVAGQALKGAASVTTAVLAARAKTQAAANAAAAFALKKGATPQQALAAAQRVAHSGSSAGVAGFVGANPLVIPIAVGGVVLGLVLLLRKK